MKKVIGFDVDDTLVVSKEPLTGKMSALLADLLEKYEVCIISGGKYEIFQKNIIDELSIRPELLTKLHLMPTCGTRYFHYSLEKSEWELVYAEDLTEDEKQRIVEVTENLTRDAGLWPEEPFGEVIEDRHSQIAISMLGQEAPAQLKYEWAEKNEAKRSELRQAVQEALPEFEVRSGGTTTLDITVKGIDKSHGITKLLECTGYTVDDILYVGDKLEIGGNDYPVKELGVDCIDVDRWEDTSYVIQGILGVTDK